MRTTIILPDELYRRVKERAHQDQSTVTSLLETALRHELERRRTVAVPDDLGLLPPSGSAQNRPLVDLADKEAVARTLGEDDFATQRILAESKA